MPTKWLDRSQPQTLYIATLLMYINAALSLLLGATYFNVSFLGLRYGSFIIGMLLIVGMVAGALGVANEKKWGYLVAVIVAVLLLLQTVLSFYGANLLTLIFEIALLALLLHPQSREYRRIWFK